MYRRALAIFERILGPEHYEIAINLNNLAALYQARGETSEAEALYRRALAIKEKLLGPAHPDVAMTLNNLAVLLKSQGRHQQAAVALSAGALDLRAGARTGSPQDHHLSRELRTPAQENQPHT